ncbi:toll/interleukin-1 receptor domain-containing protein [Limimaricola litoreus]|uniref:Toll/interleukin-1 receptor domain-containing protein n=1 Tax=Limimaricola litoreus TaxID=2955316 RepID=A0A9X2JR09_9RHOB|nr:toll/interleukin-1 receptor domain-containing protein [Limimaricola litoreus]
MKAFISYSHADYRYVERLHVHLKPLKRQNGLETWYDRDLLAGDYLDKEVMQNLEDSDIFIAMTSPDFIASDYCYSTEMKRAVDLQNSGCLRIVSIILEPCQWKDTPLAKFLVTPRDGKPISEHTSENSAFLYIADAIKNVLSDAARKSNTTEARSNIGLIETNLARDADISTRYRSKKIFSDIDRAQFRDQAFETVAHHIKNALLEIDAIDGITTRFDPFGPSSFSASIANRNISKTEHITVHSGAGSYLGDIFFSHGERQGQNTSNGSFNINFDDFEMYFDTNYFSFGGQNTTRLQANDVAEKILKDLIERSGLTYA